jgi:hypothetical protein
MEMISSFLEDFKIYVSRITQFNAQDWLVYISWNGLMFGLLAAVSGFLYLGASHGVTYPLWVWNIPVGVGFFVVAIAIDTVGHRTVYKEELKKGEALIHHMTIFSGITSVLALCLGYAHPEIMRIPAIVLIFLSIAYSFIDEAIHWIRYMTLKSDRIEMWSHYFILVGHLIMILSWWKWFEEGYPGVKETLQWLSK